MTSIMEKIPKMKKVICEVTVVNSVVNSSKSTCEEVYQEDFFNKTDVFSKRLQQLLLNTVKPVNSGHLRVLKIFPLLRGACY